VKTPPSRLSSAPSPWLRGESSAALLLFASTEPDELHLLLAALLALGLLAGLLSLSSSLTAALLLLTRFLCSSVKVMMACERLLLSFSTVAAVLRLRSAACTSCFSSLLLLTSLPSKDLAGCLLLLLLLLLLPP
jgi:hypothetical protein